MKSLLNRRSVLSGPSHLVQFARDSTASSVLPDATAEAGDGASAALSASSASAPARPVTTLRPVPTVPAQATTRGVQIADTAEVEWLAQDEALMPFRVFRSFDYSVSLLFHAKEVTYYVVLYQDGAMWRALKGTDLDAAETAFHHFEDQATRLSEGETRRAQLQAQNEQITRTISRYEAHAERLRSDLQRRGAHDQAVTNRQHQVHKDVTQLEAQRVAAQAHLNKAQRQAHQLNLTSNEAIPHLPGR